MNIPIRFSVQLAAILLLPLVGCSEKASFSNLSDAGGQSEPLKYEFRGRAIDVERYLEGLSVSPSSWVGNIDKGVFYFVDKSADGKMIKKITLPGIGEQADLSRAELATDEILKNCTAGNFRVSPADGALYFTKDENNNELFNLFRVRPESRHLEQVSHANFVSGFGISRDGGRLIYLDRSGNEGTRISTHLVDLSTMEDRILRTDDEHLQNTWSLVSWQPNGQGFVVRVNKDGDRNLGQLQYFKLVNGGVEAKTLLPDQVANRYALTLVDGWANDTEALYLDIQDGVTKVFAVNVETATSRLVLEGETDVTKAVVSRNSDEIGRAHV